MTQLGPMGNVIALVLASCGPMYSGGSQPAPGPAAPSPDVAADEGREAPVAEPEPAPAPARAAAPATARSGAGPEMDALLAAHNAARAKHCAPPLAWSKQLAASAQAWANQLRDRGCLFEHSSTRYGENLAGGTSGMLDGRSVTAMWYDEVAHYNFARGGFAMKTGHFTQVVWRATTEVGCATSTCKGMDLWVCQYNPGGNVATQFERNVLPTSCQ